MLRIRDPSTSVPFYQNMFGMRLLDTYTFSDFSLFFLGSLPEGETWPEPGTSEAHQRLWTMRGT
jgi:lactoylglutathione lyase